MEPLIRQYKASKEFKNEEYGKIISDILFFLIFLTVEFVC